MDFRILGPVEVADDEGRLVPLGAQRQRALLALLLIHANEVLATDRIVDELWGEQPPRTATTSLQNSVSQLRKVLGADRLVTRPPGYALRIDADELDLARFERLVAEARGGDPEARAETLTKALSLWRGAPLADLAFEAFAQGEIRRLEELRLAAVEERLEAELELGRHDLLVPELEALIAAHPLRERLRGQLMLALYRAGRQADALQAYQGARRALVEELGIDPGPALQQLHGAILRQEAPAPRPVKASADDDHYDAVVKALLAGRLVPVLGGGVNACADQPDAAALAARLARAFDCPPEYAGDLTAVSQYAVVTKGVGPLYDELHDALRDGCAPGDVHRFLASVPALLRESGAPQPLIVTANYDLALEQALTEAGEEFDVFSYIASGPSRAKFLHVPAGGDARVVDIPNTYTDVPTDRPVLLKIYGQVDRDPARERESFVVSEDDYIGYIAQTELANVVPVTLAAKLRRSHFLFLGYPLLQWSLRVFLQRVWTDDKVAYRSWAVEPAAGPLASELWRQRGVDLLDVELAGYVAALRGRLDALAPMVVA